MSQEYRSPPGPTSRPGRFRWWPLLVPVAAWAGVLAAMHPDCLTGRGDVSFLARILVYDESDLGALVLRGANAHAGRLPGRLGEPPWTEPPELAAVLDAPPPPLAPRYYLEYPTPTLLLFRLGYVFQSDTALPPAVADSHHHAVAYYFPRTHAERELWQRFRTAGRFYATVMLAGLVGLMVVLARGYEPGGRLAGPVWLVALPGAVYFGLNRFDVLPALATAVGFACLGRNRPGWSGVWMAVGVLAKVYPVLFVPVVLRHLGPTRAGVAFLAGFAGTLLAGFGAAWLATDWQGVVGPIRVQLSRELEQSWTFYGRVLPESLGHWKEGRLGILTFAVLAATAIRPRDLAGVLRRCCLVLVVFTGLAVFWSPQWVVWFLPLLVPLGWLAMPLITLLFSGGRPWLSGLLLVAWDVGLESLMTAQGYWTWHDPRPVWSGAPVQNFLGWWAVGAGLSWSYLRLIPGLRSVPGINVGWVYAIETIFFPAGLLLLGYGRAALVTFLCMGGAALLALMLTRRTP